MKVTMYMVETQLNLLRLDLINELGVLTVNMQAVDPERISTSERSRRQADKYSKAS